MKILINPDIHGRIFWKYSIDHIDEYDKIIFLGDYLDPYRWEGISFDSAISNFKEIIGFKKNNPDKVILLLGNHDYHYLYMDFMDCSRLNYERRAEVHEIFDKNEELFKPIFIEETFIFSHAAIHKEWLDKYNLSLNDLKSKNFPIYCLADVSFHRGGYNKVGSCIWADINESVNHDLIKNYYQIVGHTQLESSPYITKNIACLDVRRPFSLDSKTNIITDIINNKEYKI